MNRYHFGRYAGPLVVLGGLVAITCLVSTWYLNRLEADLGKAVRQSAAGMEAAEELQIRLRQLRFHSLMAAADPSPTRRKLLEDDSYLVSEALTRVRQECDSEEDLRLIETIEEGNHDYERELTIEAMPKGPARSGTELIQWADAHPVQGLLVPCRQLVERARQQMGGSLVRSDAQTTWAGRVLLALGFVGALGGVLTGYATARGITRKAAQLSVRVQAVKAQLDQEVGAMTVEGADETGNLDVQLDRVIDQVKDVCRRLQEQERDLLRAEQLAAVGRLAAGVAHEVRNPLTGIKLLIQAAVRQTSPTELTPDRLRQVLDEIVRIERTVQELMDFARTPPPQRRAYDMSELIREAIAITRCRADNKSVTIEFATTGSPLPASVDRDQMLSLLTNVLFNAVDAVPSGGHVGISGNTTNGGIRVEVHDSGPGIDPLLGDRLFSPFATTKPTGTGLGLTVARRVAETHGGTLIATNRQEGGAAFILTLPTTRLSHVETAGR